MFIDLILNFPPIQNILLRQGTSPIPHFRCRGNLLKLRPALLLRCLSYFYLTTILLIATRALLSIVIKYIFIAELVDNNKTA